MENQPTPINPGDPKIALHNIRGVVRAYRGTADEHDQLRISLETISKIVEKFISDLPVQK